MLSNDKIQEIWNTASGYIPGCDRHFAFARAIEQAAIAEQAAPAGEAVGKIIIVSNGMFKSKSVEMFTDLPPETLLYTTHQPAGCERCDLNEAIGAGNTNLIEVLEAKVAELTAQCSNWSEAWDKLNEAAGVDVAALNRRIAELAAERDILILDVASNVTVRTEQAGSIARLIERLKAYQQAWDKKDLHKQLSQLVFNEAHGVEFERAYQLLEQQITTLTDDKARAEAVIEKCHIALLEEANIYRENDPEDGEPERMAEALVTIADYQKGAKS